MSDFARRCKDFAKILSFAIKNLRADNKVRDVLKINLDQTTTGADEHGRWRGDANYQATVYTRLGSYSFLPPIARIAWIVT